MTYWAARIENSTALAAELEPIFLNRAADEWEAMLTALDIGAVRADKASHVRYLHSDPQPLATHFMVMTSSNEFADQVPKGRYWRHAPVVKFSGTPCEAGKPYEGPGHHTRQVLRQLGYDDTAIDRLREVGVIGLEKALNRELVSYR
jgi:crotonobetainyl-CoA:carnitine CoA-transferase CaiB-like acyl-CoA transferase